MATALLRPGTAPLINPYAPIPESPQLDGALGVGQAERGLRSAAFTNTAGEAATDYYKAQAAGDVPGAQAAGLRMQTYQQQAEKYAPRVQSVGDIHGVGDAADWAMGVAGQLPTTLVPAMAGGLVGGGLGGALFRGAGAALGGHLGAGAAMYPQMRDAARMQQAQAEAQGAPALPAQQVLDDTSNQGLIQANIEALVPDLATRSLLGQGAKAALTKPVGGALRRVGRDIALDSGAAGLSEGVAMNYETGRNPGRDTSGDTMRYADAMASEAMGGGVMGAAGHAGDLAHTALGTGVQATGDAAAYAARLAEQGGAAGMAKAKELWSNRPKTLDEAAVMAGEGAAKLHTGAEDAVTRVLQRGKDADVDTLLSRRTDRTERAMRADDAAKHQAATNFIAKNQANTGDLPGYVKAAMADYAAKPKGPFSWEPLADAVNDMHRAQGIGTAFKSFVAEALLKLGEVAAKLMNAKGDAVDTYRVKREMDKRANAQTPDMMLDIEAARDDLSPLLDEALAPLTGLKSQDALDNTLPSLAHGMRAWVENNFSMRKNGEPVVPSSLLNMFTDPKAAVATVVTLLHKQGVVDDSILGLSEWVIEKLDIMADTKKSKAEIVHENLVPTEAAGANAFDHDRIARLIQDEINAGNNFAASGLAKRYFGPRAGKALAAFRAKDAEAKARQRRAEDDDTVDTENGGARTQAALDAGDRSLDGTEAGGSFEELNQMTNARDPNTLASEVTYHHYRPAIGPKKSVDGSTVAGKPATPFVVGGQVKNKDGSVTAHDKAAATRIAELQAKNGTEIKKQGYLDYLREYHADDPNGLMQAASELAEKDGGSLSDAALNKKYYVLREASGERGGPEGNIVHPSEFDHITPGTSINKWAEGVGKDRMSGDVGKGRIWLKRASDGEEFATSSSRIIRRMLEARESSGSKSSIGDMAGQAELLHQGLASLLASGTENDDGTFTHALKDELGFMDKPGGTIRWTTVAQLFGTKNGVAGAYVTGIPDSLRMHSSSGQTYKDAKAAVQRGQDQELSIWAKARYKKLLERTKNEDLSSARWSGAMMDLQRLEKVLASKSRKALEQLRREHDYERDALRYERDETQPLVTNAKGEAVMRNEGQREATSLEKDADGNWGTKQGGVKATSERAAQKNMGVYDTKRKALTAIETLRSRGDTHEMRVVKTGSTWSVMADVMLRKGFAEPEGEISEMGVSSNFSSRQEDGRDDQPRNVDELTGATLDTPGLGSNVDEVSAKREVALTDALRRGVPALEKLVRAADKTERAAMYLHLRDMATALQTKAAKEAAGGRPNGEASWMSLRLDTFLSDHSADVAKAIGAERASRKPAEPAKGELHLATERQALAAKAAAAEAAKKTRAERTAFLVDGLAKSVPGFVASVRKISAERRDALLAHLKTLVEAGTGNPIWGGKPPADMDQFAARARVALVEMGAMKGAVKGPIPKKPAAKTVAAKTEAATPVAATKASSEHKLVTALKQAEDHAAEIDAWTKAERSAIPKERWEAVKRVNREREAYEALHAVAERIVDRVQAFGSEYAKELKARFDDLGNALEDDMNHALIRVYEDARKYAFEFADKQPSLFGDTKPSAPPAQKFGDVLKRMNDYLDNRPAVADTRQLEAIRDWATRQEARLNEAKSKYKEGQDDEWGRLDDLRFEATTLKAKATKAIANEAEVEAHHAEQGGPRYNAQSPADHKWMYHGTRAASEALVQPDGSLVLKPSKNLGGKTFGVSFAQDVDSAKDYATRIKGGGPKGFTFKGAKILKIDRAALKGIEEETFGEWADYTGKDVVIPKGSYTIEPVSREKHFMRDSHLDKEFRTWFKDRYSSNEREEIYQNDDWEGEYQQLFLEEIVDQADSYEADDVAEAKAVLRDQFGIALGETRYNAMATRLHEDLGREGFAATHDSPIKHEGKFDWRKHKGKGEGGAAFGAGTYLSTANGVHRDYKEQFTQNRNDALTQAQRDSFEAKIKKYADDPDAAELVEEYRAALVNDRKLGQGKSPTYEVSVNIKPEHMLDWNKPLSEQSEFVQKALAKEVTWRKQKAWNGNTTYELAVGNTSFGTVQDAADTMSGKFVVGTGTYGDKYDTLGEAQAAAFAKASGFTLDGANIYKGLVQRLGSQAAASDYLQSLGILGHTYDAAGGKNDKYRNHVIYDDSKITTNYVHFNKQDPKHKAFGTAQAATPEEQAKFHADILRRLGPQMKSGLLEVLMGKNARGKDIYLSGKWEKGAIYASVYARNLDQIGAHEAFHEFFSRLRAEPAAADVLKVLDRAASSPYVTRQLERLLDGETEALKQIKQGAKHAAEERMAYMFQFHQAGLLKLGPETETVFQKIARFFRKVAGLINDDERADLLLRAFDRGEAQTADAAARVLANSVTARAQMYTRVNEAAQPMLARASRLVNTAETNLERQGVEEYHTIRRLFKRSVGESGEQGYLDAKDHLMKQKSNELFKAFQDANGKDYAPADLALAAKYLHTGKKPTDPVVRDIVKKLTGPDGILPRMHKYLKDAGVMRWEADEAHPGKGEWVPMGKIDEKYFPRVYDTASMVTKPDEFVADLVKYNAAELNAIAAEQNALLAKSGVKDATPVTAEGVARGITNRLINAFGEPEIEENSSAVGFSPVMQAVNKRSLHWLAPEVLEKWGEKDVAKIMTSYVAQGIKRAEYVRRFGNGGEKLQDMLKAAHDKVLDRMAEKEFGPNARGIYTTTKGEDKADQRRVIEAALATAGQTDVKARLDALEIKALKVAKGAATDVMALEGTLGYDIKPGMRRFQNSLLVYENMRLLSTSLFSQFIDPLGIVVRGGTMTDAWSSYKRGIREVIASIKGDPIKDLDAQIADQVGTTDANGFLAAFGQLYSSQYMGDKFRKANDVLFKYNGMEGFNRGMQVSATRAAINFIKRHATQPNDNSVDFLKELNLTAKDVVVDAKTGELDYTDPKIQQAIHQWVNGSIMRPNAAQRPAWGSDPHYMVFWHMKQFAYTFHDVIMKRAMYNYKTYGDMGPLGTLLMAYTPVMIATDALKGVLLSGGDEPGWMRAGLGSELQHGAMRAGLAGKFQPGVDVMGPHRTVLGLGGPAIEQIVQMFEKSPVDSAINALPGANVWNTMKGGPMVEMQGED